MGFFSTIGHVISSAGHSFATTLDPHLKELENEYNSMRNAYNVARIGLLNDINTFDKVLEDYRAMAACNSTLLIADQVHEWDDTRFINFLAQTKDVPALSHWGLLPGDISTLINKNTGSNHVVHFLVCPTNAHEFGLSNVAVAMEEGGVGSKSNIEAIQQALLFSAMGLGGMVMADIVFGEVEYPKQIDKLRSMYQELLRRRSKVVDATKKLKAGILQERQSFLSSIAKLATVQTPDFRWQLSPSEPDLTYQHSMVLAVQQYGIVFRLRKDWINFRSNKVDGTYQQFVSIEAVIGHSAQYSVAQVEKFTAWIAQATSGSSLNAAWIAAGRPTA